MKGEKVKESQPESSESGGNLQSEEIVISHRKEREAQLIHHPYELASE